MTQQGWVPVVAPELEFYLVEPNTDPTIRWSRRSADPAARRPGASPTASRRQ